jgi:glycosyltransferase involved in cell wall biosynthesis
MITRKEATAPVIYLSSYPPRECGIATFTQDLSLAFNKKFNPTIYSRVVALNDQPTTIYNYNSNVVGQLSATEIENYVKLARKLNQYDDIKIINIQHEFGIFGGSWGDYLIPFLQVLEKPVVITFHSVLPNPDDHLKKVVHFISNKSRSIIVMNKISRDILVIDYGIPRSKIEYIPHGIPQVPFENTSKYKKEFGLENKLVLSTFGMLSKDKGIEYAIRALPTIVKKYPNLVYLVIGETHPIVRKCQGEEYRNFLIKEVHRLGLKNHIKFYNKYITLEEITRFLRATDIYISPILGKQQSVSGTLSYALGCGRVVISTPTSYAKYIVNKENGELVRFRNFRDISKALIKLCSNKNIIKSMSASAYSTTRPMTWPNVAESYYNLYTKHADLGFKENKFPVIKIDHLNNLTDNFGIFQHAKYTMVRKKLGYSTDDNARALIVCALLYKTTPNPELIRLIKIYLNFISFVQRSSGSFANIVNARKRKDHSQEDDVQGRVVWALGKVLTLDYLPQDILHQTESLFNKSLTVSLKVKSPRAVAFVMTGLYFYLKKFPNKKIYSMFVKLADKQVQLYKNNSTTDWQWFEDYLTYSNSKLSESIYYAYDITRSKKYLNAAEKTLSFLKEITFGEDHYSPIGQAGWYFKNKERSYFDQQPEDAAAMVQTKIIAYKITKDRQHLKDALTAFKWFLGKNHLGLMVYDEVTGGCLDGLGKNHLNLNQGAESTISYLLARLEFEDPEIIKQL